MLPLNTIPAHVLVSLVGVEPTWPFLPGGFEPPAYAVPPQTYEINGRCSATELRAAEAARQDSNLRPLPLR